MYLSGLINIVTRTNGSLAIRRAADGLPDHQILQPEAHGRHHVAEIVLLGVSFCIVAYVPAIWKEKAHEKQKAELRGVCRAFFNSFDRCC